MPLKEFALKEMSASEVLPNKRVQKPKRVKEKTDANFVPLPLMSTPSVNGLFKI